jgi:hypothetical protein
MGIMRAVGQRLLIFPISHLTSISHYSGADILVCRERARGTEEVVEINAFLDWEFFPTTSSVPVYSQLVSAFSYFQFRVVPSFFFILSQHGKQSISFHP